MRVLFAAAVVAASVLSAPVQAADIDAGSFGAERAQPLVLFDFEPGMEMRAYWLPPFEGRHYYPGGGKPPRSGRRELLKPATVPEGQRFHREWHSFNVDSIVQPPLVYAPQAYYPSTQVPAPTAPPTPGSGIQK